MADELSQNKFSNFYATKNGMIEPTCERLYRWKFGGEEIGKFRCNNAEENKKLQKG